MGDTVTRTKGGNARPLWGPRPTLRRGALLGLSWVLVATSLAGAATPSATTAADGSSRERQREVTMLVAPDATPQTMAGDLAEVARKADVRLDRVDLTDASDLARRISSSHADLLIVLAHGDAGKGIAVGGSRLGPSMLLEALGATRAKEVDFAVCDLGLPTSVHGTKVLSYTGTIDAHVATVDLVQEWSDIYDDAAIVLDGFVPAFYGLLQTYGGPQALAVRALVPQDPLRLDEGGQSAYDYPCEHRNPPSGMKCSSHEAQDDENQRAYAESTTVATATTTSGLSETLQQLRDNHIVTHERNAKDRYEHDWQDLFVFHFRMLDGSCFKVLSLKDIAAPGYTLKQSALDFERQLSGTSQAFSADADALYVAICSDMFGGILADGTVGGGGQLNAQVHIASVGITYTLGRGHWFEVTVSVSADIYVTFNPTVFAHAETSTGHLRVELDLQFEVDFVADGNLPWAAADYTVQLYGPVTRSWILDPTTWTNSAAPGPAPTDAASPGVDRARMLALTRAELMGVARDPSVAARLEEKFGRPLADVPEGTILDLADPTFHDIFEAPGSTNAPESLHLPDGFALGNHVMPRVGAIQVFDANGCGGFLDLAVLRACGLPLARQDQSGPTTRTCTPTSVPLVLAPAVPLAASACVVQGADGSPSQANATVDPSLYDVNGTVSPYLKLLWSYLDPWCAQTIHGPCPYTYPTNLCGWVAEGGTNSLVSRLSPTVGPLVPPIQSNTLDAGCFEYRAAAEGTMLGEDAPHYFEVSTELASLKEPYTTGLVDLCDTGINDGQGAPIVPWQPGCTMGGAGFGSSSQDPGAPRESLPEHYFGLLNHYVNWGGSPKNFQCGITEAARFMESGEGGSAQC